MVDLRTSTAGALAFGLTIASLFVKDPATSTLLGKLAVAVGAAGLGAAADSRGSSSSVPLPAPPAAAPPQVVIVTPSAPPEQPPAPAK